MFSFNQLTNHYNNQHLRNKDLYDPSIGQESLTIIDVAGVLIGHLIFGVVATLLIDWSWIPLSPQQRESGRSLKQIKRSWGWHEKPDNNEENQTQTIENLIEENNE